MVRSNGKLPKKRLGMKKNNIQQAPEHSSSDEGVNSYLPAQAEKKKTMNKSRRDALKLFPLFLGY